MYDTKPPVLHRVYSEKNFRCKIKKTIHIVLIKSSLSTLKAGQLESVVCWAGPHREHGTVVDTIKDFSNGNWYSKLKRMTNFDQKKIDPPPG